MLVSYNWLKDYLDVTVDPADLAETITRTGIEIETLEHPQEGLKKIVVGHVLSLKNHENSDHLRVAQVDVGEEEPYQIVCGAPNIAEDQYVIVALPNSRIAGNEKIKKGKLRGVVSQGMICGLQEIGFSDSVVPEEVKDGIYVFEDAIAPGTEVYEALGMDDYILDFDITPNRADTLSMEGAAYEVGAILSQKPNLKTPEVAEDAKSFDSQVEVSLDLDESAVSNYRLRYLTDVNNAKSPLWMQTRLMNAGTRPVNTVVDALQYAMIEMGQPLTAFDADKIQGDLQVRFAKAGETIQLKDQDPIELDTEDIVIADDNKILTLGGVATATVAEVDENTTSLVLQSAIYDGALVRKSAQRHGVRTDSSARYEKGINWDNTQKAIDYLAQLIAENGQAKVLAGTKVIRDTQKSPVVIDITTARINHVLGTELSTADIIAIFERLQFGVVAEGDTLSVSVPARRFDISIDADLVEEVARLYGYDNLPTVLPVVEQTIGGYDRQQQALNKARDLLVGFGLDETINYSLTSHDKAVSFVKEAKDVIALDWPMTKEHEVLRQNLVSGLLDSAVYNAARKQTDLRLFEQGRVFSRENGQNQEVDHIAGLYVGQNRPNNWQHDVKNFDFYEVKGQVEAFLKAMGFTKATNYVAEPIKGMHPTRTAAIYYDGQYVGFVGQIDPRELPKTKLKEVYAFELDMVTLLSIDVEPTVSKEAPKYPEIKRDLSLLVDEAVTNSQIISVIDENGGKYLRDIQVFDVYSGDKLEAGKQSIAYQLTFQDFTQTLKDDSVNEAIEAITQALTTELNISVR
ncbi:phenylalanine--tRNA ligase subunit beta [Holzapfeliella sp. JNUCC 72]